MLYSEISNNQNEASKTKRMFENIQKSVGKMVAQFKHSKFYLCVASKMSYEDGITFTENNIVSYLAELEEYISSLIIYTAFKRDDANAAISSIPLEKLDIKDFNKAKINLPNDQIPTGILINEDNVEAQPDEVYGIIDRNDLYKKFQELYSNNILTVTKAGNKN